VVSLSFTGRLDSCIVIRALHIRNGVARLSAGAGIVADSKPASEYAEVARKMSSVREALTGDAPVREAVA
jgi:anthranilate synthase component 1